MATLTSEASVSISKEVVFMTVSCIYFLIRLKVLSTSPDKGNFVAVLKGQIFVEKLWIHCE